jgi:hypothetical protein
MGKAGKCFNARPCHVGYYIVGACMSIHHLYTLWPTCLSEAAGWGASWAMEAVAAPWHQSVMYGCREAMAGRLKHFSEIWNG